MKTDTLIEKATQNLKEVLVEAKSDPEKYSVIERYSASIQPNFIQWLSISIFAARSEKVKEILRKNLYDEITQDHPEMLRRFYHSAKVQISPEAIENSTRDLYYISGDVFDRGY